MAAGVFLIAVSFGMGCLSLSLRASESSPSDWRGFRVLLVDATIPEADVLSRLAGEGVTRVISESTEPVLVSDWSKLQPTSLAAARRDLAPGDPRLDSYLDRLGLWFAARAGSTDCRVYYVVDGVSEERISKALRPYGGAFRLPDESRERPAWNGFFFLLASLLILTAAVVSPLVGKTEQSLLAGLRRRRIGLKLDQLALRLSLAIPWIALACGGLGSAAIATFWALACIEAADSLDIPLEEFRLSGSLASLKSVRAPARPAIALSLCAILALALSPRSIASVALACFGSGLALAGYALASSKMFGGKRFVPLPIGRYAPRRKGGAARRLRGILACAMTLAWGLCDLAVPRRLAPIEAGLEYPRPQATRGSARPSVAEARSRCGAESDRLLPGIASFLEHKAMQESMPYLRFGEARPDPFEAIALPMPAGKAQTLSFDDAWARKSYAALTPLCIESMLLAQGGASVGVRSAERVEIGATGGGRPLAPIRYLLYILLMFPLLARLSGGLSPYRESPSSEIRQEA
jgi:hypothetical protein